MLAVSQLEVEFLSHFLIRILFYCERKLAISNSLFHIRQLKVGSPKDATTNVGALVSKEHLTKVMFQ